MADVIATEFTYPINTALWFGAQGMTKNDAHKYEWQSDNSGNIITLDAAEADKRLTEHACKKLKSDYRNNVRIYVN